jgi:hypothetical protein
MSPEFYNALQRLFITAYLVVSPVGILPPPQRSGELPQGGKPFTNLIVDGVDLCSPNQDPTVGPQGSTGMVRIGNSSDVRSGPAEVRVTTTSIGGIESESVATSKIAPLEPGQRETVGFTTTLSLPPGAAVIAEIKTTDPPDGNPKDNVASGIVHGPPCSIKGYTNFLPIVENQ